MNTLIKKIDEMIQEKSLLKHPFYQMWSDGKLTLESLAGYSKEYFQLVKAVPSFMTPIIDKAPESEIAQLVDNQNEEFEHISHWITFASSLGVNETILENYTGLDKTNNAIDALSELMISFDGGSCAMYAFEKEIPKVSQTKLDGLLEFYDIASDKATSYFKLHTEADIRHAATWQNIIENSQTDHKQLVNIAAKSISAQNLLLDSCYEAYC